MLNNLHSVVSTLATSPTPPTAWSNLLAVLPTPTQAPSHAESNGDPAIPLDERLTLAAEWLLPQILAGVSPTPREVRDGVKRFREVYQTANAVGTLLGRGVRGRGLNLYRRQGRVASCYENARRLLEVLASLNPVRLAAAARQAGLPDPESLSAAVLALKTL